MLNQRISVKSDDKDALRCWDDKGVRGCFLCMYRRLYQRNSEWIECSNKRRYVIENHISYPRIRHEFAVYVPEINGYQYNVGGKNYCSILKSIYPSTICAPIVNRGRVNKVMKRIHLLDNVSPSSLLYRDMIETGFYDSGYARYFIGDSIDNPISWSGISPAMTPFLHAMNRAILSGDTSLYEAYRMIDSAIKYDVVSLVLASMIVYEPVARYLEAESRHPPDWIRSYGKICSMHRIGGLEYYGFTGISDIYKSLHTYGIIWCDNRW